MRSFLFSTLLLPAVLFTNCSPSGLQTTDLSSSALGKESLASRETPAPASPRADVNNPITAPRTTSTMPARQSTSATSTNKNSVSQQAPAALTETYNCEETFKKMNWYSPTRPVSVTFGGSGGSISYEYPGYTGKFYRDFFILSFYGPVSPQPEKDSNFGADFALADSSGISFRLLDSKTKQLVSQVNPGSFKKLSPNSPGEVLFVANNNFYHKNTRLQVGISRLVFDETKNAEIVDVEILCHGNVVAQATQDLRTLDYEMLTYYENKIAKEPTNMAPNMQLNCTEEAVFGGPASCEVGSLYLTPKLNFIVNGQTIDTANAPKISTTNSQRGLHTVQARGIASDGRPARSPIVTIYVP